MEVSKFRIAVYGILIQNNEVLMARTIVPRGEIWNFPGGGLNLGEAPDQALVREFVEEAHIDVKIGELLYCSRKYHQDPDFRHEQNFHVYYEVKALSKDFVFHGNKDDVLALKWWSLKNLPFGEMAPADLEFAEGKLLTLAA